MAERREARQPEDMTKAALLNSLGRKLTKAELVAFHKAVANGYRPYVGDVRGMETYGLQRTS
jgi:hypothetical protein